MFYYINLRNVFFKNWFATKVSQPVSSRVFFDHSDFHPEVTNKQNKNQNHWCALNDQSGNAYLKKILSLKMPNFQLIGWINPRVGPPFSHFRSIRFAGIGALPLGFWRLNLKCIQILLMFGLELGSGGGDFKEQRKGNS